MATGFSNWRLSCKRGVSHFFTYLCFSCFKMDPAHPSYHAWVTFESQTTIPKENAWFSWFFFLNWYLKHSSWVWFQCVSHFVCLYYFNYTIMVQLLLGGQLPYCTLSLEGWLSLISWCMFRGVWRYMYLLLLYRHHNWRGAWKKSPKSYLINY